MLRVTAINWGYIGTMETKMNGNHCLGSRGLGFRVTGLEVTGLGR